MAKQNEPCSGNQYNLSLHPQVRDFIKTNIKQTKCTIHIIKSKDKGDSVLITKHSLKDETIDVMIQSTHGNHIQIYDCSDIECFLGYENLQTVLQTLNSLPSLYKKYKAMFALMKSQKKNRKLCDNSTQSDITNITIDVSTQSDICMQAFERAEVFTQSDISIQNNGRIEIMMDSNESRNESVEKRHPETESEQLKPLNKLNTNEILNESVEKCNKEAESEQLKPLNKLKLNHLMSNEVKFPIMTIFRYLHKTKVLHNENSDIFHIHNEFKKYDMKIDKKTLVLLQIYIDHKYYKVCDKKGFLPIHQAVIDNDKQLLLRHSNIFKKNNETVDQKSLSQGLTPSHLAASLGNVHLLQILLSRGSDPLIVNSGLMNCLHLAKNADTFFAILTHLVKMEEAAVPKEKRKSWVLNELKEMKDCQGRNPIELALGKKILSENYIFEINSSIFLTKVSKWSQNTDTPQAFKIMSGQAIPKEEPKTVDQVKDPVISPKIIRRKESRKRKSTSSPATTGTKSVKPIVLGTNIATNQYKITKVGSTVAHLTSCASEFDDWSVETYLKKDGTLGCIDNIRPGGDVNKRKNDELSIPNLPNAALMKVSYQRKIPRILKKYFAK